LSSCATGPDDVSTNEPSAGIKEEVMCRCQ
jgi:hypothetical protein